MLTNGPADLTIRPWSKGKLDLLGKYIGAYSKIIERPEERVAGFIRLH